MTLHPKLNELLDEMLPIVQDFHRQGMFAPHAAFIDDEGNCTGSALTTDGSCSLSVSQALDYFENRFSQLAAEGKIQASAIFYHSSGVKVTEDFEVSHIAGRLFAPADHEDECHILVVLLEHAAGDSVYLQCSYTGQPPSVDYQMDFLIEKPAKVFNCSPPSATPE
ncbi:hypothetical protein VSS37_16095 [Candidatus Thiothrix sp. Deng01]|uniref:Uncharacterized protein n=1 Tax=Candidatus Thiothrix phosphatis TaxID=3112415 RepID=A0ABU6D2B5_9GAMM|nr:hypothetical protein [Candidatus Thiothrix sp. Deng01]MEB4592507.1 hypothetical protein [Candidatus Thiothrix sp. Deng01]